MEYALNSSTTDLTSNPPLVSREVKDISERCVQFLILLISAFGVVTNCINIRVFTRQGITSDSTTIGLFALAVSDFFSCLTMLPCSFCYFIVYYDYVTYMNCVKISVMPLQYPHVNFSRVTSVITVYLSIERTLCVVIPLKVKLLLKPKVSAIVMICIYAFFFFFSLPLATNIHLVWVFDEKLNSSIARYVETDLGKVFSYLNSLIGTTILCTLSMLVVIFTTLVLVLKLNSNRKWRETFTTDPSAGISSMTTDSTGVVTHHKENATRKPHNGSKEREIVKTVTMVTVVYLICLVAGHIPGMAILFLPDVSPGGANQDFLFLMYTFRYFFEVVNSSVNFLFYVRISSKYRKTFYALYGHKTTQQYEVK